VNLRIYEWNNGTRSSQWMTISLIAKPPWRLPRRIPFSIYHSTANKISSNSGPISLHVEQDLDPLSWFVGHTHVTQRLTDTQRYLNIGHNSPHLMHSMQPKILSNSAYLHQLLMYWVFQLQGTGLATHTVTVKNTQKGGDSWRPKKYFIRQQSQCISRIRCCLRQITLATCLVFSCVLVSLILSVRAVLFIAADLAPLYRLLLTT